MMQNRVEEFKQRLDFRGQTRLEKFQISKEAMPQGAGPKGAEQGRDVQLPVKNRLPLFVLGQKPKYHAVGMPSPLRGHVLLDTICCLNPGDKERKTQRAEVSTVYQSTLVTGSVSTSLA